MAVRASTIDSIVGKLAIERAAAPAPVPERSN
jgi:hypothetical protein